MPILALLPMLCICENPDNCVNLTSQLADLGFRFQNLEETNCGVYNLTSQAADLKQLMLFSQ